ncbi:hypothetical protein CFK41_12820 [Brachybacterium ginsengisoli]|uniref:Uncharacterized protein n=1 Tax=Brachybacterium ginsengisoli TaxID=1331682 RepID=A0A291GZL4_9MICO|nr:hypothetical protein [Brachybacterium ginsengisoli]ATG55556.1 hypothetical protein CFK41_12820 [Brachybacterium ginsengisoli]
MTSISSGRLLRLTVAAGAVGALSLIEPRRLGPWTRAAYRVGTAAVSGLLVADTTTEEGALLDPTLDGLLGGGVTLGLMDLSEHLDHRIVGGLHRLGVSRPRLLLAGIGAAGAAVLYLVQTPTWTERGGELAPSEDGQATVEMPEQVRALIAALLEPPVDGGDHAGAPALRTQLDSTRIVEVDSGSSDVMLVVERAEHLAVPWNQTWPVTGRFDQGGFCFSLELQIDDGRLGMLSVMVLDEDERADEALEFLDRPGYELPTPQAITLHHESESEEPSGALP